MLNDSRGLLWMGTQYGIKVLSPDRKIDVLGEEHGFENLTIQAMQEDYNNEVWITTINALYKVSVAKEGGQNEYTVVCLDRNHSREWDDLYEFCSMRTRKENFVLEGWMDFICFLLKMWCLLLVLFLLCLPDSVCSTNRFRVEKNIMEGFCLLSQSTRYGR